MAATSKVKRVAGLSLAAAVAGSMTLVPVASAQESSTAQESAVTVTESATTTVTPSPTEPTVSAPEEPSEPAPVASSSVEAAPARTGACELKDLRITAMPNQPSYATGTQPVFYMEVENPTDTDCVIDLDENILRFEVYNMRTNEKMWADTDCYEPVVAGTQTYKAGQKQGYQARWSGTVSQPGQCEDRPAIEPGSYFLHTVIGDNASDAAPFNIT